jgi:hypothetical protein
MEVLPYATAVTHTQLLGCQTVTAPLECQVYKKDSRIHGDLDTEKYKRAVEIGRFDTVEPLHARQAFMQMISDGMRSKKDIYTRTIDNPADNWCSKTGSEYRQM